MITYKPIIIPGGRRKDGIWPVKIRVTFKGVSRRIPTTLACTDADLTRGGRIKNATILERAGELIARMRAATSDLSPFTLEAWTVDDVVEHIREAMTAQTFRLDFFAFADSYLTCKQGRTRGSYETALNTFARFLGRRELDVNDITRKMILDFAAFVDAEPNMHYNYKAGTWTETKRTKIPGGSSAMQTAKLAHIFAAARFRYNDEDTGRILIPRSPFDGLRKAYPPGRGQRNLGVELIQRFIDAEPADRLESVARATFLLSFCLLGANLADLWAQREDPGPVWIYNRQKTATRRADRAEVQVLIPEQARPFIAALATFPGGSGWWLPELHRWGSGNTATAMLNKGLRSWAEREGVEPFTFYAARHSFASLARREGVEKATIDEALAHIGDFRITDIYAERNWNLAWEAGRKVLDLFVWDKNRTKIKDTESQ